VGEGYALVLEPRAIGSRGLDDLKDALFAADGAHWTSS
jgi:hypothetical protein